MSEEANVNEHRIYFECPYVRCNWWAAAETVLDARRAVAEHCREVHARHALNSSDAEGLSTAPDASGE